MRAFAAYDRSLRPATSRRGSAEKAPPHILDHIQNHAQAKTYYFQIYMNFGGSWNKVSAWEKHYTEKRASALSKEAWLTRGQMMFLYHDDAVVTALADEARGDATRERTRRHPRIPHIEAASQFLIVVEDSMRQECQRITQQGISLEQELGDDDASKAIVRDQLRASAQLANMPTHAVIADTLPSGHQEQQARSGPATDSMATTPDEANAAATKRKLVEAYELKEAEKKRKVEQKKLEREQQKEERRVQAQREREQRDEFAKTPEGRGKIWLDGLSNYIAKADAESMRCHDQKACYLPDNLAREYAATWDHASIDFKKHRATIEKALKGDAKALRDFPSKIQQAEQALQDFKDDHRRFQTLENDFKKKREGVAKKR